MRQRVQRLLDAGVMQIVAVTDPLHGRLPAPGDDRHPRRGRHRSRRRRAGEAMPEVDYVVVTAGSFDLLVEVVCEDDDHLLELLNERIRAIPGVAQHRDLRLPEAAQADLHLGHPMTHTARRRRATTYASPAAMQESARRHLWMHFTRMSSYDDTPTCRSSCAARAPTSTTHNGKRYLDGLAGLFVVQVGHGRAELAEAAAQAGQRARVLPAVVATRTRRRSSWPSGSPTYAPGDLNRVFFTTGGGEAVETAWKLAKQYFKLDRQADQAQGDQPRHRLPRHPAGRAVDHRHPGRARSTFEPLVPGRAQGAEHQLLPRARARRRPRGVRPLGRRPDRARPSRSRAPTPSPRSSSSRCRTPAAASRRRPATSSGCARSATGTTCCWSPTRSSARSAGSARCSRATRYGYVPDIITCAKGMTSGYSPIGAMIVVRPARRAVPARAPTTSRTATPSAATRCRCAVALANLDIFEREGLNEHVLRQRGRVPRDAGEAQRPADRRRRPRRRLLLRHRAGQGQGHQGDLRRRRVRAAAARLPVQGAVRRRACTAAPTTAATRSSSWRRR